MSRPGFLEGVGAALAASLAAGAGHTLLGVLVSDPVATRALVATVGLGYVLYLLARSPERVGRVTTIAIWCVASALPVALAAPLLWHVLVQAGLIWLIRSLYYHSGALSALADLALMGIGLLAGVWAAHQSGSVFLVVWCFFLVQALFVAIPSALPRGAPGTRGEAEADQRFERAYRSAEAALRKFPT